jgi:hypothetical protein
LIYHCGETVDENKSCVAQAAATLLIIKQFSVEEKQLVFFI